MEGGDKFLQNVRNSPFLGDPGAKIVLEVPETGSLFCFGFRFAFLYYSGPLIFTTRLKQFEGELARWTVQF